MKSTASLSNSNQHNTFVSVILAGQLFGIPIHYVREILKAQTITKIPLAPSEIAGSLNLRGRVVTAINLYARLNLKAYNNLSTVNVVVENQGELYSLMIDAVVDVLQLSKEDIEPNPSTLNENWYAISSGIVQYNKQLMIIMNIESLLDFKNL